MQAVKKKGATRAATTARPKVGKGATVPKYTGLFVEVMRDVVSRAKRKLARGVVLFAIGEPDGDWVPVLVLGRRDAVKRADVQRIVPKAAKKATTAERSAAARRVSKRAGVKMTSKEAERISRRWER